MCGERSGLRKLSARGHVYTATHAPADRRRGRPVTGGTWKRRDRRDVRQDRRAAPRRRRSTAPQRRPAETAETSRELEKSRSTFCLLLFVTAGCIFPVFIELPSFARRWLARQRRRIETERKAHFQTLEQTFFDEPRLREQAEAPTRAGQHITEFHTNQRTQHARNALPRGGRAEHDSTCAQRCTPTCPSIRMRTTEKLAG